MDCLWIQSEVENHSPNHHLTAFTLAADSSCHSRTFQNFLQLSRTFQNFLELSLTLFSFLLPKSNWTPGFWDLQNKGNGKRRGCGGQGPDAGVQLLHGDQGH